jgi:hypothetical protein
MKKVFGYLLPLIGGIALFAVLAFADVSVTSEPIDVNIPRYLAIEEIIEQINKLQVDVSNAIAVVNASATSIGLGVDASLAGVTNFDIGVKDGIVTNFSAN